MKTYQTADAKADLSLRWAHMPFCWFCHAGYFLFLQENICYRYSLEAPQLAEFNSCLYGPHRTKPVIIILPSSRYVLSNVERDQPN